MGGFPKIRGTILGVPRIGTIVYCGLHFGSVILGDYHIGIVEKANGNYYAMIGYRLVLYRS